MVNAETDSGPHQTSTHGDFYQNIERINPVNTSAKHSQHQEFDKV